MRRTDADLAPDRVRYEFRGVVLVAVLSGVVATAGSESAAELRIRIDGEVTGLAYPLRVRTNRGVATVLSAQTKVRLIASERELQPIQLDGFGEIWLLARPGESLTLVEQPCCGITLARSETAAPICPKTEDGGPCPEGSEAGDSSCLCPKGSQVFRPALAQDPICGPSGRCIAMPRLRRLKTGDGPSLRLQDGTHLTPEYRSVSMGPGHSVRIVVDGSPFWLALVAGRSYSVSADRGGIASIRLDSSPGRVHSENQEQNGKGKKR